MGFLIQSDGFNQTVREALEGDFSSANAWRLELRKTGQVLWAAGDKTLESQPAMSFMQRIEDWFFSNLPVRPVKTDYSLSTLTRTCLTLLKITCKSKLAAPWRFLINTSSPSSRSIW